MVDFKTLEMLYFSNNKPVPYKLMCGQYINIYPIKVEDWGFFENCIDILRHEKNEINDPRIVMMSYLDYIIELIETEKSENDNSVIEMKLSAIISASLKEDHISIEKNNGKNVLAILNDTGNLDEYGKPIYTIKSYLIAKEFDELRKIIMYQNIYDYDDTYLDPEIRDAIQRFNKLKNKDQVSPTLERQKVFVISKTGMSMEKINNMTYRTFSQVYKLNVKEDLYLSRYILKASEKYVIKEDIVHPLYEKEKTALEEIFVDADSFKNKLEQSI